MNCISCFKSIPLIFGVNILFTGIYFVAIKAGIPYQDPTPELTERYMFFWNTGKNLINIGIIFMLVGICIYFAIKKMKPTEHDSNKGGN